MIKCLMEKGPRSGESILKYYMLYPERFIGVDRKVTTDFKLTPCESKKSPTEIGEQQTSVIQTEIPEQQTSIIQTKVPEQQTSVIKTEEPDQKTSVIQTEVPEEQILVIPTETPEQQASVIRTEIPEQQILDAKNSNISSSGDDENPTETKETVEDEENDTVKLVENSSSSNTYDSSSSDTSNLIDASYFMITTTMSFAVDERKIYGYFNSAGFSSGISVRLKDFSSGPTTPRAGFRKSRRHAASRKIKRMRPTTSPTYRQKGQFHENSRRLQYICRTYAPQRYTNLYTADFKALQKKLVNEKAVGDANCRSHNVNICEGSSPPKRKMSRVRAVDPLKNRYKSLWTSRSTPDREKFLSGQPYTLLCKKLVQQAVNRISKSRGRTKNLSSSKGRSVLKNKSTAEVYSFTPPPRTVGRHKQ